MRFEQGGVYKYKNKFFVFACRYFQMFVFYGEDGKDFLVFGKSLPILKNFQKVGSIKTGKGIKARLQEFIKNARDSKNGKQEHTA